MQNTILYATVDNKCYRISSQGSDEVPLLQCNQEEADGRLLLHAAHAAREGYEAVVICSEDTDVFILALAFQDKISAHLFQRCGTRTRKRLVDIKKVAATLGTDVCKALIGIHSYTGCDTVSAFAGKGKAKALKLLTKTKLYQGTFLQLGEQWELSPEVMDQLEAFTCQIYAPKAPTSKVNNLRYHLFCARKGEIESHQLPPCRDCLVKHALRANYQAGIWRRCLEQDAQIPNPVGKGWTVDSGQLVVHWMDGEPAPQAILDLLACNCTRTCQLPSCECMANGLKCTDMCKLPNCGNQAAVTTDDESEDENDDEYEQEDEEDY